jgi:hypothetical protein
MAFHSEPNSALHSAEYWDEIDIQDPAFFDHPPAPISEFTKVEVARAAESLSKCLYGVMLGLRDEVPAPLGSANEIPADTSVGTVLALDYEQLQSYRYTDENRTMSITRRPEPPPIDEPFSDYWLRNQRYVSKPPSFGTEVVAFPEQNMLYTRLVFWAVVTKRGRRNMLAQWLLEDPEVKGSTVDVRADRFATRHAKELPVVGSAVPEPAIVMPAYTMSTIRRVRSAKVILPRSANV